MENFERNTNSSEDMRKDVPVFKNEELILTDSEHLADVIAHENEYKASAVLKKYNTLISNFHSKVIDVSSYLEAKEKEPVFAGLLSEIMTTRPAQPVREMELLQELQKYDSIIKYYEQKNIDKKSIEELKKMVDNLKSEIITFSKIEHVAKNTPELN